MGRVADATVLAPRGSDDAIAVAMARSSNNRRWGRATATLQRVRSCPSWSWAQGGCAVDPASLLLGRSPATPRRRSLSERAQAPCARPAVLLQQPSKLLKNPGGRSGPAGLLAVESAECLQVRSDRGVISREAELCGLAADHRDGDVPVQLRVGELVPGRYPIISGPGLKPVGDATGIRRIVERQESAGPFVQDHRRADVGETPRPPTAHGAIGSLQRPLRRRIGGT